MPKEDDREIGLALLDEVSLVLSGKSALPARPLQSTELDRIRQTYFQSLVVTFWEAIGIIEQRQLAMLRSDGSSKKGPSSIQLATSTEVIAKVNQFDALEELRQAAGLLGMRNELERQLFDLLDEQVGLGRFSQKAERLFNKRYDSFPSLSQDFPNVTALELSFIAWLDGVPEVLLTVGRGHKIKVKPKDRLGPEFYVPYLLGATPSSLVWSDDSVDLRRHEVAVGPVDAFDALGFTEKSEDFDHVLYQPWVTKMITQLTVLRLKNKRLHEIVWHEASEALQRAIGMIWQLAFTQITGRGVGVERLPELTEQLDEGQRASLSLCRKELETKLLRASIYDATVDGSIEGAEVFRLLGLLVTVPEWLVADEPFVGYLQPYGLGVLFFHQDGTPVGWVPYTPYLALRAREEIYGETTRAKENRTVYEWFTEVRQAKTAALLNAAVDQGQSLSTLEEIRVDIYLSHGIDIDCVGAHLMRSWRESAKARMDLGESWRILFSVHQYDFEPRWKIGLDEARFLKALIEDLPRFVTREVKMIGKQDGLLPLVALVEGYTRFMEWNQKDQAIIVTQEPPRPFAGYDGFLRILYAFGFVHECGHSIWQGLTDEEVAVWTSISWGGDEPPTDPTAYFATWYATRNAEEDFCEHFAYFFLFADDFRDKAKQYPAITAKYAYLNDLSSRRGGPVDPIQWSPLTSYQVLGGLQERVKKLELEEALKATDEEQRIKMWRRRRHWRQVYDSIEELARAETEAAEREIPTKEVFNEYDAETDTLDETLEDTYFELRANRYTQMASALAGLWKQLGLSPPGESKRRVMMVLMQGAETGDFLAYEFRQVLAELYQEKEVEMILDGLQHIVKKIPRLTLPDDFGE